MEKLIKVFEEREVLGRDFRIYGTVENPLFLAKDVALWIEHSDVSTMIRKVDEEEKVTNNVCTLGGVQEAWFLTEDGLYEVLMQSRKPIAKQFKKKVKEILKQIRQTGGYIPISEEDTELEIMSKAMLIMQKTLEKKNKLIEAQQPKVEVYNILMDSKGNVDFATFAKSANLAIGRNKLIAILRDEGILFRKPSTLPKQQYVNSGYFEVVETVVNGFINSKTLITAKGQDWLLKKCIKWDLVK